MNFKKKPMYDHAKGGFYHSEVLRELLRRLDYAMLDLTTEQNELWQYWIELMCIRWNIKVVTF